MTTERPHPDSSDEALILATVDGEEAAFAALFRRHGSVVLGFLVNMLRDKQLAEEVLQEVFLQVWKSARKFDPTRASLKSWLFLLARSRATDALRSNAARQRREQVRAVEEERMAVDNPSSGFEARATVEAVLEVLTPEQQECVRLAFFEGMSISQISTELDIPLGTAKSRYLYGMRKLRAAYRETVDETQQGTSDV